MPKRLTRQEYVELFGPTVGDRVRLGDTELWAEVEKDYLVPGDECVFGGGKTLRDGLGMHGGVTAADGALDFVITNALVIDAVQGVVKADIGIKDGRIAGIGKAGNPQIMDGVDPALVVGANTDVRSAEGMIATAGGIDVHVHFDSAGLCEEAIASGITTMLGGGLGPVTVGICSSGTDEPRGGCWRPPKAFPLNFGFLGKGSRVRDRTAHRADSRRRDRPQDPRGLGCDACRDQVVPRRRRRAGRPGPDPHGHPQRIRLLRTHDVGDRRPDDPHLSLRGCGWRVTPPTSSGSRARPTASRRRRTRPIRTRSTPSTSTSTWSWCATT